MERREAAGDEALRVPWDVPWTLLATPADRLQRVTNATRNPVLEDAFDCAGLAPTRQDAPGIYEQGLGAMEAAAGGQQVVPFFLGETGELGWQIKQYAATGGLRHLAPIYSEAMRRGLFVFVRWRRLGSRAEAQDEQKRLLALYDYAGNASSDAERRMPDVFCILDESEEGGPPWQDGETSAPLHRLGHTMGDTPLRPIGELQVAAPAKCQGLVKRIMSWGSGAGRAEVQVEVDRRRGQAVTHAKNAAGQLLRHMAAVSPERAALMLEMAAAGGMGVIVKQAAMTVLSSAGWYVAGGALAIGAGVVLAGPVAAGALVGGAVNLGLGMYNNNQQKAALEDLERKMQGVAEQVQGVAEQVEGVTEQVEGVSSQLEMNAQALHGMAASTAQSFSNTNSKIDALGVRLDGLELGINRNAQLVCNLAAACAHAFCGVEGRINMLEHNLQQHLDEQEDDAFMREVQGLQQRIIRRGKVLMLEEYNEDHRQSLIDNAINVITWANSKLEKLDQAFIQQPDKANLLLARQSFVMLRTWATRAEADATLWSEQYWLKARGLCKLLHRAELEYEALNRQLLEGLSRHQADNLEDDGISLPSLSVLAEMNTDLTEQAQEKGQHIVQLRLQLAELRPSEQQRLGLERQLKAEADAVAEEALRLVGASTLYELAVPRRRVLEQYVHLHRGLLAGLEEDDGSQGPDPDDCRSWDGDGLNEIRELVMAAKEMEERFPDRRLEFYPDTSLHGLIFSASFQGIDPHKFTANHAMKLSMHEIGARLGLPLEYSERLAGMDENEDSDSGRYLLDKLEKLVLGKAEIRRGLVSSLQASLPSSNVLNARPAEPPALEHPEMRLIQEAEQVKRVRSLSGGWHGSTKRLLLRKRSSHHEQLRGCPRNVDHFSKAELWVAIKLSSSPELHKFPAERLQTTEMDVPLPQSLSDILTAGKLPLPRIEMLVFWLDLAANYKYDEHIDSQDFTIALKSIEVSALDCSGSLVMESFSYDFGKEAQVWDGGSVVILDASDKAGKGKAAPIVATALPMHDFSLAGRTKCLEVSWGWEENKYIYWDKYIHNCFNQGGKWEGPGKGCKGGIYRRYGGSSTIEAVLDRQDEGL